MTASFEEQALRLPYARKQISQSNLGVGSQVGCSYTLALRNPTRHERILFFLYGCVHSCPSLKCANSNFVCPCVILFCQYVSTLLCELMVCVKILKKQYLQLVWATNFVYCNILIIKDLLLCKDRRQACFGKKIPTSSCN